MSSPPAREVGAEAKAEVRAELLEGGALLRLTFSREGGNVLTGALMRKLEAALVAHVDAPHLKLVTLEGAGKHMSFGASVEEHRREQAAGMLWTFHTLVKRLVTYPVPIAAVVRGKCLGGAFELALACRFVFASREAVFACPEIKLGVLPPVLAALGPLRLGHPATERLLLTGAELGAPEAARLGFATVSAEGVDAFDDARAFFRSALAGLSAYSLRQANEALRRGSGLDELVNERLARVEQLYLEKLLPSHDGNEGIAAFLEKRTPTWRDA